MLATDYTVENLPTLPTIIIETIPHDRQRYSTCGDWFYDDNGDLRIKVSHTNTKYDFLIAVHEMIEAVLCGMKGVKEQDVTDFDVKFEKMRSEYPEIVKDKEPGDDDEAPYNHQHLMASRVEKWLADSILGNGSDPMEWKKYEDVINSMLNEKQSSTQ